MAAKKKNTFGATKKKVAGREFKKLTSMGMNILTAVDAPFATGDVEDLRVIWDYLFVCDTSIDRDHLLDLAEDKVAWGRAVMLYSDDFAAEDTKELSEYVAECARELQNVLVEVRDDDDAEEEGKP